MKNLIIIGARGYGRVVFNLAISCTGYKSEYQVKGFLDDKSDALDGFDGYPSIIDTVENYQIQEDDVFICALGEVANKKKYVQFVLDKGGNFISLIHPLVKINQNSKIGKGCMIFSNVIIGCDAKVDDFATIQAYAILGHDSYIGKYCYIDSFVSLGGYVYVENEATIYPSAVVHPRKKIGTGSVVGAGAIVIRNVKNYKTVYGNPAIILK
jgi:sugar O-acyltransferase (sialic acid O-acetyltransferase NeuD family)